MGIYADFNDRFEIPDDAVEDHATAMIHDTIDQIVSTIESPNSWKYEMKLPPLAAQLPADGKFDSKTGTPISMTPWWFDNESKVITPDTPLTEPDDVPLEPDTNLSIVDESAEGGFVRSARRR